MRLDTGGNGGLRSNGADSLESPLTDNGILLVAELLLENLDSLGRERLLRNRTTEVAGQVSGGSVHLILATRHVEVLDKVLEHLDGLSRLLAGDSGNGRRSGHIDNFFLFIDQKRKIRGKTRN